MQLFFLGRYIVYHPIGLKKCNYDYNYYIFFRKLIYVTADAVMIRDYLQETSFSQKNKILKSPGNVIAAKVYSSLRRMIPVEINIRLKVSIVQHSQCHIVFSSVFTEYQFSQILLSN